MKRKLKWMHPTRAELPSYDGFGSSPLCIFFRLAPTVIETPYDRTFRFFPFLLSILILLQFHLPRHGNTEHFLHCRSSRWQHPWCQQWSRKNTSNGMGKFKKAKYSLIRPDPSHSCTDTPENNWNSLGCDVSDSLLLDTSAKLVSSGLRDVGYTYVVLDDCWSAGRRDSDQWLLADQKKFPRGMKAVADDIHALGLLFGMYSSAGEMTCARFGK